MATKFSIEAVFKAVDKVTAPISRMQNRIGQMTRSMERGFKRLNRTVQKFERGIKSAGRVAVGAAVTVGTAFAAVAKTGADFQQQLVNAAVKVGPGIKRGTKAFKQLEDAARKTGKTTQFTATQAASAEEQLAKSGFGLTQITKSLTGEVNFAIAAQMDMAEATRISTKTLTAFGLKTNDAAQNAKNLVRVNDDLVVAANQASTNVDDLFEALGNAGTIAKGLNMSLEQTLAIFDTLANNGKDASAAGTQLRTALAAIVKPSKDAQAVFNRLNISLVDAHGNTKNLLDVFDDIKKSKVFQAEGGRLRNLQLLTIFGRRAFAGVSAFMRAGTGATREFQKQLEKAAGTSKRFSEVMRNTFKGKVLILMSAVQERMIQFFEKMDPHLEKTTKRLTKFLNSKDFDKFMENLQNTAMFIINNFPEILMWTKRVIEGFLIFKVVTTVMRTFILVMETLNLVMAINPFVLFIAGIGLLILAIVEVSKHWRGLFKLFDKLPAPFRVILKALTIPVIVLGKALVFVAGQIGEAFKALFDILKFIFEAIAFIFRATIHPFNTMADVLTSIPNLIKAAWRGLGDFFKSLWKGIIDDFNSAIKFMEDKINKVRDFFSFGTHPAEQGVAFGKDQDTAPAAGAQVVSPHDRTAKTIQETRKTSTAEVTIKDGTGRAEVTKGKMGPGLALQTTGNF